MNMAYKLTDFSTFNRFVTDAVKSLSSKKFADDNISKAFKGKILLAVTQVNGCKYCSYLHAKNALKNGVAEEELEMLLGGEFKGANSDEYPAILFAQHYAETRGQYDEAAFHKLQRFYGEETANGIMSTIKIIMAGNTHGIALDLLKMRFSGKRDKESNLLTEIGIFFGAPVLVITAFIKNIFNRG